MAGRTKETWRTERTSTTTTIRAVITTHSSVDEGISLCETTDAIDGPKETLAIDESQVLKSTV